MKNPMDRQLEKRLSDRAVAIGREGETAAFGEFQIRPDFYLPELDLYIEYWGLDTPQYKMSMYKKQMLYQQEGKRLISVYPRDLPSLDALLTSKLRLFGYAVSAHERSEVSALRSPSL